MNRIAKISLVAGAIVLGTAGPASAHETPKPDFVQHVCTQEGHLVTLVFSGNDHDGLNYMTAIGNQYVDLNSTCSNIGPKGDTGAAGADGKDGAQGEKGDTGEQGAPGADGKDGVDGKDGTSVAGQDGAPGLDGVNGVDGKDGKDAADLSAAVTELNNRLFIVEHTVPGTTTTTAPAAPPVAEAPATTGTLPHTGAATDALLVVAFLFLGFGLLFRFLAKRRTS